MFANQKTVKPTAPAAGTRNTAAETIASYKRAILIRTVVIVLLVAFIILLGALALYFGSLSKEIPYVIELSTDGEAYYHANTVDLLRDWTPSDATQRYFISHYVIDMRSVSTDNYRNKDAADSVFQKSLGTASSQITQWYADNNPITRSSSEYVIVPTDDMAVVLYSSDQWKVTWRETTYRRSDNVIISDKQYEAIFTVAFYTPDTERRKRENPIGMYVTEFSVKLIGSLM